MRPVGPVQKLPEQPAESKEIEKVARDFEGIFVRQLLSAAKFGDDGGKAGFGSMVVDALATSVTEGGGIGLAQRISEALDAARTSRTEGEES